MASLKEIKTRIASVKSTLKITSAMKMVASAKLHKAQAAIGNKLPYEQKLHSILAGLLRSESLRESLARELGLVEKGTRSPVVLQDIALDALPSKAEADRVAIVVFSSNSSLCGSFNANAAKKFRETADELLSRGYVAEDVDVYTVGRKVAEEVRRSEFDVTKDFSEIADRPSYENASALAEHLIDSFTEGSVSQVIFVYNHFASPASQPSVRENYLPLALYDYGSSDTEHIDYILEPDPMSLVRELLPKVLLLKIYTVVLDSNAAEHAARTMAMQIASDNAQDLISELTLAYNKGRQQAITAEILDIVGGSMNN